MHRQQRVEQRTSTPVDSSDGGIDSPDNHLLRSRHTRTAGCGKADISSPTPVNTPGATAGSTRKLPGKFRDLVYTRTFSAFDRQNQDAVNSPFRGFYTLFWLSVALFMLKTAAENWRLYGNPLGTNDIMKSMFRRDGKPGPSLDSRTWVLILG
jgi:hypothetical protein